ncbi:MAG: hypothetical protein ABSA70_01060 [Terriglobia bacterium]
MTLLDAQAPKPPGRFRKLLPFLVAVVVVLPGFLYLEFRDYPEERAVARFLTTLQQGNYREAYQLWQPSSSYTFADFLRGWGEQGDYGKIRQFEILGSKAKGSNTVIVTVRINNLNPPLDLLVDRRTKGLAYSVF